MANNLQYKINFKIVKEYYKDSLDITIKKCELYKIVLSKKHIRLMTAIKDKL